MKTTEISLLALPLRDDIGLILDAHGNKITEIKGKHCECPDIVAAEIVRRVNCHDELVVEFKRYQDWTTDDHDPCSCEIVNEHAYTCHHCRARTALDKAKGG